jgi:hypothetical protein
VKRSIYIMSVAARGHRTPNSLSPHIHPISSSFPLGSTTFVVLLSWRPRRINVRRILLQFPGAWKAQSSGSFDSYPCEVLARGGWPLHVSLRSFSVCYATQFSLSSWEFFTALDYEWRIIRSRLRYRWTIWVRNNHLSSICHIVPLG